MSDQDYERGSMDVSMQSGTYNGVMKFSGLWGMPFSIALGVFFTALLRDTGISMAFLIFLVVFFGTRIGVKAFFSH